MPTPPPPIIWSALCMSIGRVNDASPWRGARAITCDDDEPTTASARPSVPAAAAPPSPLLVFPTAFLSNQRHLSLQREARKQGNKTIEMSNTNGVRSTVHSDLPDVSLSIEVAPSAFLQDRLQGGVLQDLHPVFPMSRHALPQRFHLVLSPWGAHADLGLALGRTLLRRCLSAPLQPRQRRIRSMRGSAHMSKI